MTSLFTVTLSHNLRGDRSRLEGRLSVVENIKIEGACEREMGSGDSPTILSKKCFEVCLSKFPLSRRLISEKRKEQ